jgi:hypothetical protein
LGKITAVDGDPGTNKSYFLTDITARFTTGKPMPESNDNIVGSVLMLIAEDGIRDTVHGRLTAAGADMDRVAFFDEVEISLPEDINTLRTSILMLNAKLVIFDPFSAYVGGNTCSEQAVRRALNPLRKLAEETNAAMILVRHLNRTSGTKALYRGFGSIAIGAVARSALLVGADPKDENMRVLSHYKNNLGPLSSALLYRPVEKDGMVRIEWHGHSDYKPEDLLAPKQPDNTIQTQAEEFLVRVLANGPLEVTNIRDMAKAAGFGWRTVQRAKEELGVRSNRKGFGTGSKCYWMLSAHADAGGHAEITVETKNLPANAGADGRPETTGENQELPVIAGTIGHTSANGDYQKLAMHDNGQPELPGDCQTLPANADADGQADTNGKGHKPLWIPRNKDAYFE